jgi:hypothetical protein
MNYLKEKWTEEDVLNLPEGEHDFFERKAGRLFNDKGNLYAALAKALSALANSGGGHLILGQENNGMIDGIPSHDGRTPIREWLEQKAPYFVAHPLQTFRVHTAVESATGSAIPPGKVLVVIDVGDSHLAPHQAIVPKDNPQYYCRMGGHSVPAPHYLVEALRNRLTKAVLEAQLDSVHVARVYPDGQDVAVLAIVLGFTVKNVSRIASYEWDMDCKIIPPDDDIGRCIVPPEQHTVLMQLARATPDNTILPTKTRHGKFVFGFRVRMDGPAVQIQFRDGLLPLEIRYCAISENHIGEPKVGRIADVVDGNEFWHHIVMSLQGGGFRVP